MCPEAKGESMQIDLINIKNQYRQLREEIDDAVSGVMESGAYVNGYAVNDFETSVRQLLEVKHAIACNSGTDALQLLLMALDIGPGDEVITTPFSFVATAEVIALLGAKPVFVDIDAATYNLDVDKIAAAISPKTKAIMPVHLYGQAADMDPLLELANAHQIPVLEDAAQAFGARYKGRRVCNFGHGAGMSFYPTKNLGTHGDGGMVMSNDDEIAAKVRFYANHGQRERYYQDAVGINSRLDAIQAAILNVKIKHIDEWNAARRGKAALYNARLAPHGIKIPHVEDYAEHIYHQYTIAVDKRDALAAHLKEKGIPHGIYYPVPLHLQKAYHHGSNHEWRLPVAEKAALEVISLPIHADLSEEQIDFICTAIGEFYLS
jgi:dTDP-4-amino-4,6-dideoxygalactose transaminase